MRRRDRFILDEEKQALLPRSCVGMAGFMYSASGRDLLPVGHIDGILIEWRPKLFP